MTELFTNVVRASFYGSIVIAVVCLLRLALKRAPKSLICLLWLLAGLRLVMPFEIESRFSLQPELDPVRQEWLQSETADVGESVGEILDRNGEVLVEKPLASTEETSETSRGEILDSQGEILVSKPLSSGAQEPLKNDYETLIPSLWLAGMAAMLLFSMASCWKLKRKVREAWLTGDGCWECDRIETAFVLGFLRPRIYLPVGLGDREREFILAHEQTHIRRRDHLWKLAGYAVLTLHWFNPLVWLAYSLLCKDIELACDEQVVKNMTIEQRKAYSGALLSCAAKHGRFAACPVAFGETDVKGRIKNVLNYKKPGFWITVVALIAALFVAVCLMTSPAHTEEPEQIAAPATPENAEEIAELSRKALMAYQNQANIAFTSQTEYKVDEIVNTAVCKAGENWFLHETGADGEVWYMKLDDVQAVEDNGELMLAEFSGDGLHHWLVDTNWESANIDVVGFEETTSVKYIDCIVEFPFTVRGETAPDFWMSIVLDKEDRLDSVLMRVCVDESTGGKQVSRQLMEEKISFETAEPEWICCIANGTSASGADVDIYEVQDRLLSENEMEHLCYIAVETGPDGKPFDVHKGQSIAQLRGELNFEVLEQELEELQEERQFSTRQWSQLCKELLKAFQRQDNYALAVEQQATVGDVQVQTATQHWYRHGGSWLCQSVASTAEGTDEISCLNYHGLRYSSTTCYSHHEDSGLLPESSTGWVETPMEEWVQPWLTVFDWDAQAVSWMEYETRDGKDYVTFRVQGHKASSLSIVDSYEVTFVLRNGSLHQVVLDYAEGWKMRGGSEQTQTVAMSVTMTPQAVDPEVVEQKIVNAYNTCQGELCTVENCTDASHGHENHQNTDCTTPGCTDDTHGHQHHDH